MHRVAFNALRCTASTAIAVLMGACGGGGGGGTETSSNAVSLSTPSDVQRELSLSGASDFATYSGTATGSGVDAIQHTARSLVGTMAHMSAVRRFASTATNKKYAIRPRDASACGDGGTSNDVTTSGSYNFTDFESTQTVSIETTTFANCAHHTTQDNVPGYEGTTAYTYNGQSTESDSPNTSSNPAYFASDVGNSGTPLNVHQVLTSTSGTLTSDTTYLVLGNTQEMTSSDANNNAVDITFSSYEIKGTETAPSSITGEYTSGNSVMPMETTSNSSGISIDGPYSYSSTISGCSGGDVTIETISPITINPSGADGGTVKLSSGSASVTVVFQSDNSAQLTFSNGTTATLTADQVNTPSDCGQSY